MIDSTIIKNLYEHLRGNHVTIFNKCWPNDTKTVEDYVSCRYSLGLFYMSLECPDRAKLVSYFNSTFPECNSQEIIVACWVSWWLPSNVGFDLYRAITNTPRPENKRSPKGRPIVEIIVYEMHITKLIPENLERLGLAWDSYCDKFPERLENDIKSVLEAIDENNNNPNNNPNNITPIPQDAVVEQDETKTKTKTTTKDQLIGE